MISGCAAGDRGLRADLEIWRALKLRFGSAAYRRICSSDLTDAPRPPLDPATGEDFATATARRAGGRAARLYEDRAF